MNLLGPDSPQWRTRTIASDYPSNWDDDWFYHFRRGGYTDIEWLEITVRSDRQRAHVGAELRRIHVPGFATEFGFRVIGYADLSQRVDYL